MLALELEVNVSCAKSALWWSCMVVYISHICAFHVEGQSVSGVTLSRTIFLLLKDEKFSEECSKYFSSVLRSNCLEILYCFADVRYLDIKPWGTPRNHGNVKVQTSTWKKGNYSLEWKHIPFDFQHTSDGKNYYSCSVDSSHFFSAENSFMYLIIRGGMREKLHLGPTWHALLTPKHIISSDINFFFSLGFDWHPVSIQTIWGFSFAMKLEPWIKFTLTGYTAARRGNCRLWCHQLILTIWIKKSINVTASEFNMTLYSIQYAPSVRALGGETDCEHERENFGVNLSFCERWHPKLFSRMRELKQHGSSKHFHMWPGCMAQLRSQKTKNQGQYGADGYGERREPTWQSRRRAWASCNTWILQIWAQCGILAFVDTF